MLLVFSDEFNTDGRSFYPGDDPYWEAGDMHYWVCLEMQRLMDFIDLYDQATNNLEWYDPSSVTTADGSLVITFSQQQVHDLNYQSGKFSYNFIYVLHLLPYIYTDRDHYFLVCLSVLFSIDNELISIT